MADNKHAGEQPLLSVQHLCQYFNFGGHKTLKAVHNVSFDIYKGETFGLVGESGCGKTTTGRSIIKLYDITGGNIYFKGQRIGAGTLYFRHRIREANQVYFNRRGELLAKTEFDNAVREANNLYFSTKEDLYDKLNLGVIEREQFLDLLREAKEKRAKTIADAKVKQKKVLQTNKDKLPALLKEAKDQRNKVIAQNKIGIAKAKHDQKNCDKMFAAGVVKETQEKYKPLLAAEAAKNEEYKKEIKEKVEKVKANYEPLIAKETDVEKKNALKAEYKAELKKAKYNKYVALKKEYAKELRVAKRTRLVTNIQMIFQDPIGSLNPRMTVGQIIAEGLIIKGITDKEYIQNEVYKILDLVGLQKEHATRYPHEFSGGQRQRIGIARSVIMKPEMIIADEPVSALDVSIQAQVINLLNELKETLGLTILFIAHDLSVVKYFSDRIGVMYFGDMVELASSDEIFAHPLHPYTKSLLSAIPLPDPEYEKKRVRIAYNPIAEHDYSVHRPSFREIAPNHFVWCNDEEELKYKEEYSKFTK